MFVILSLSFSISQAGFMDHPTCFSLDSSCHSNFVFFCTCFRSLSQCFGVFQFRLTSLLLLFEIERIVFKNEQLILLAFQKKADSPKFKSAKYTDEWTKLKRTHYKIFLTILQLEKEISILFGLKVFVKKKSKIKLMKLMKLSRIKFIQYKECQKMIILIQFWTQFIRYFYHVFCIFFLRQILILIIQNKLFDICMCEQQCRFSFIKLDWNLEQRKFSQNRKVNKVIIIASSLKPKNLLVTIENFTSDVGLGGGSSGHLLFESEIEACFFGH